MLISAVDHPHHTSPKYFDYLFPNNEPPWKEIHCSCLRSFNYKVINNVLHLNKKLFQGDETQSSLCSFYHTETETIFHVFHKCTVTKIPWDQILLLLGRGSEGVSFV